MPVVRCFVIPNERDSVAVITTRQFLNQQRHNAHTITNHLNPVYCINLNLSWLRYYVSRRATILLDAIPAVV